MPIDELTGDTRAVRSWLPRFTRKEATESQLVVELQLKLEAAKKDLAQAKLDNEELRRINRLLGGSG